MSEENETTGKGRGKAEQEAPDAASPAGDEDVEELKAELDRAVEARKRAQADFANYQRRSVENEARARQDGAANVIRSLLPVLDHFDLALNQETEQLTVEVLLGGVKIVRDELRRALESHGVSRIEPEPGEEFDPVMHDAMMRMPGGDEIEPNRIVHALQPGYALGDLILRPAKVAVAAEPDAES